MVETTGRYHRTKEKYIQNQEGHHRQKSFREELVELLERAEVKYDAPLLGLRTKLAPFQGADFLVLATGGVADAKPPANGLEPSGFPFRHQYQNVQTSVSGCNPET